MNRIDLKYLSDQDYDQIIKSINRVSQDIQDYIKQNSNPMTENWLDNADAMRILKVSSRSLQNYRDKRILPFSTIGGKIYYKASDIERVLEQNYINRAKNNQI